jgi:hypothetical protein
MPESTLPARSILAILLLAGGLCGCHPAVKKQPNRKEIPARQETLSGKWIKTGPAGPVSLDFGKEGMVTGDFGADGTIDVTDSFVINRDTVTLTDKEGQMCTGPGRYKIYQTANYLAFDLIDDDCGGRIKMLLGYWTRPDYPDLLASLDSRISSSPNPDLILNRARIYMAVGQPQKAKADLDTYLSLDSTNAGVFLNRAGARFPDDLEGALKDCDKAISLDPGNKNAWFLRGLAQYGLGQKEEGCADFKKAIELGFSVLRIAEQEKCADFWEK